MKLKTKTISNEIKNYQKNWEYHLERVVVTDQQGKHIFMNYVEWRTGNII